MNDRQGLAPLFIGDVDQGLSVLEQFSILQDGIGFGNRARCRVTKDEVPCIEPVQFNSVFCYRLFSKVAEIVNTKSLIPWTIVVRISRFAFKSLFAITSEHLTPPSSPDKHPGSPSPSFQQTQPPPSTSPTFPSSPPPPEPAPVSQLQHPT